MNSQRAPFWLWPNLLSLDAPLVAVAWVWMLKKALYVQYVEPGAIWVLFGAVWSVYVLDRIIDVWTGKKPADESPRHAFSWKYRWVLLGMVLAVIVGCSYYSLYYLPATITSAGIVGVVLSLIYFASIPFQSQVIPYAKNLTAGLIFSFGTSIPASLYHMNGTMTIVDVFHPFIDEEKSLMQGCIDSVHNTVVMTIEHMAALLGSAETLAFGVLCMLNITAIDLWEKARKSNDPEVKATNEMILTLGVGALVIFSLLWASVMADDYSQPYFYALMTAGAALHLVNRQRSRFTLEAQRVLADFALLVPIPFYYIFTNS